MSSEFYVVDPKPSAHGHFYAMEPMKYEDFGHSAEEILARYDGIKRERGLYAAMRWLLCFGMTSNFGKDNYLSRKKEANGR